MSILLSSDKVLREQALILNEFVEKQTSKTVPFSYLKQFAEEKI